MDLVALDCVERVAGDGAWERQLFLLFNEVARAAAVCCSLRARRRRGRNRDAGSCVARSRRGELPAAAARRRGRLEALLAHAAARGLELERSAAEYLLHRVDRDLAGLSRWLDRLDRASLIEQRKLTIPFIRGLLAAEAASGE